MSLKTIALMTLFLFPGCTAVNSSFKAFQMDAPGVVSYSRDVQNKAAVEMQSNACPTLNAMIDDYSVMRDQSRILLKAK